MRSFFELEAHGTSVGVEVRAGLTTFLTMAYILFVNPHILGKAIKIPGVELGPELLTATALAAALGTAIMGLWARYPFALAPGMGLNAYFAYTIVLGQGIAWPVALGAVFLSGVCFLALSLAGVRELVVNAVPLPLKLGISAGIGAFLALIGMKAAGLVVAHPATLVTLGEVASAPVLLALFGLALTTALVTRKVPGGILVSIAVVSVLAIALGAPVFNGEAFAGLGGSPIRAPVWPTHLFGALDVAGALELGFLSIVFVFLFVDFFDTAGTLIGLSMQAGFADSEGRLPRANRAFGADAIATMAGSILGTSTTTSYIESASGVEEGGRTGLTALVVAGLFALSIFFWPLASAVPGVATAPALIVIGGLMMKGLTQVDWRDPAVAIPVFVTVVGMPFTFSIATGISLGLLSWVAIAALSGRAREVHPLMWLLTALLVARYAFLAGG